MIFLVDRNSILIQEAKNPNSVKKMSSLSGTIKGILNDPLLSE